MEKEKLKFNETKKTHVEFLLRLLSFEDKLYAKIKKSLEFKAMDIIIENGYIINHQIIDKYKEFYNSQNLKQLISHDINLKNIYMKYKENKEYISENFINNFIKESLVNLPIEYIKEINSKNIYEFLYEIGNKELYSPSCRYLSNNEYFYYENCSLLDESLLKLLLSTINLHIFNKFMPIRFMIANGAMYLMLKDRFFCGYINNKYIYIPEIIICYSSKEEFEMLANLLKFTKIDMILQQTKRINNNINDIGIYNNTNIKIIILNNKKYIIPKKEESNINNINQQMIPLIKQEEALKQQNIKNNKNKRPFSQTNKNKIINKYVHELPYNQTMNNIIKVEIRKEIDIFIYIIIDMKKIIKKMKMPLNQNSKCERYYISNFEWFLEL